MSRLNLLWVIVSGLMVGMPAIAEAVPTCRIITYFATAKKEDPVGTWSNCPGMKGLVGRRTRYFEVSVEALPQPRPPVGTLPCEFQKDCVTDLPTPTVVEGADNAKAADDKKDQSDKKRRAIEPATNP